MDEITKQRIDKMSYYEMFRLWRFGSDDEKLFQGETGKYFQEVMIVKKSKLLPGEHSRISKNLGWKR